MGFNAFLGNHWIIVNPETKKEVREGDSGIY